MHHVDVHVSDISKTKRLFDALAPVIRYVPVATQAAVEAAAEAARSNGAHQVEGPGFHPEYGEDYYAVFFEDADGNKYEVCHDVEAS